MRVMQFARYGGPDVLEAAERPTPTPLAGELLVRVAFTSINPIDWKLGSGRFRPILSTRLPAVPGFDVSGEVAALGPGVTGFTVGQKVHARIARSPGEASAEYARVEVAQAVPVGEGMSLADAAALPLAGMTALQGLRDVGKLPMTNAGKRVCIVGASGGVGHLALQIAVAAGAQVTGVCSGRNAERVRGLGAHDVVDYTVPDGWAGKAPFDVVYDCVGGDPGPWLPRLVEGGRYLTCAPIPGTFGAMVPNLWRGKTVHPVMLKPNAADLAFLDGLHARGALRVLLDSTWPLAELQKAWERSISGRATGKIVVAVA